MDSDTQKAIVAETGLTPVDVDLLTFRDLERFESLRHHTRVVLHLQINKQRPAGRDLRSGQAIIMVTASLMFVLATMGLAIDFGWCYFLKMRVQTAADAAAVSAAVYAKSHGDTCGTISCGVSYTCVGTTPPTTSLQAGCLYATADGPPSMSATLIENNTAPPGVTGNTPSLWIKATVTTTRPNNFLFSAGFATATIAAQAIAAVTLIAPTSCIYVLNATANQALSITGTSSLSASSCGTYVNSSSASALNVTGSSTVTASGGGKIYVHGSTYIGGTSTITPTAITGAASVSDPLAALAAPTVPATCDSTNYQITNSNTATINPGTYCGGISAIGNSTLNLNPGTYILNGGGLKVSNSSHLNGTGITFFNTGKFGNVAAPVLITGNPVISLSAPTSGAYKGIAFFQDRTVYYSTSNAIANSSTVNITGTYYFYSTAMSLTGNVATPVFAAFIVDTLAITGSSQLKNDTAGTYTGLVQSSTTIIQ
jgi:hypothetical protein